MRDEPSPPRFRLARALVRLYPRRWRERYEAEMLALIDDTGLDARRAADLLYGAGREWASVASAWPTERLGWQDAVASFLFLGATAFTIASAGTGVALLLCKIPTPPVTWIENGYRMQLPPRLPSSLGGLGPLVQFLAPIRFFLAGVLRPNRGPKVGRREFCVWLAVLFVGSACWQWSRMVNNLGTGVPPTPLWEIWIEAVIPVYTSIQMLVMSTRFISDRIERQRAVREAAKAARVASVPRRPLGLS
jgi:hypothetical protein